MSYRKSGPRPNRRPGCVVSVPRAGGEGELSETARWVGGGAAGATILPRQCVVERMRYRAGEAAIVGDVVTVPLPRVGLPAPAARQGSSVARLRTTDREAAGDLFNACYPRLAGWGRRLVDDDDTAHEIASEAFTRLLARWPGLDNPQSYL